MIEPKKIICIFDTAIDHAAASTPDPVTQKMPLVEYSRSRDLAVISSFFIPGELPTYFTVQPLSRAQMNGPMARCTTDQERAVQAFTWGVIAIEGMVDNNGQPVQKWAPTGVQGDRPYCTASDMEAISPAEVQEIGSVIYQLSFLPRKMHGKLQPPHTSLELLDRMAR